METLKIKKGHILQYQGALNTQLYHVKSGLLRSYCVDEKGKEHIFMFAPEGWTIADAVSSDIPSELLIDAIEDSEVWVLPKDIESERENVERLLKRVLVLQRRVMMLMSMSAMERYEQFMETYPEIIQRVPQKMIASFLGVTPEALSKLKRDRLRK